MGCPKSWKKELRTIASMFGVGIHFKRKHQGSWAHMGKGYMMLGVYPTKRTTLTLFFHELGHFVNSIDKKYWAYHNPENMCDKTEIPIPEIKKIIRCGLKAEIYTDKVGKQLMKMFYPYIKYDSRGGYQTKGTQEWYKEYHLSNFRKELKRRESK